MRRPSETAEPNSTGHPHWITVQSTRTVLIVVHTMTAWNRLADILPIFESDRRIQLMFTFPNVSHVTGDVERQLAADGAVVIPWARALSDKFDLALSVHHSGDLHSISAPLAVMSHGIGYTKLARSEKREARSEKREARSVYGLSRDWLLHDGIAPDAIILPNEQDRKRLAASAPEALPHAVVAGDPCLDRMLASRSSRPEFRGALDAPPDSKLVTVSSTWGPKSLLGQYPELIDDLLSELSCDEHVVAAIVHPNAWFAHGPYQVRLWLANALRSGLRLIPPLSGWQQTIVASDVVVGDFGAVTGYAAALGIPTLLATHPRDEVAPDSIMDLLGRTAPTLHTSQPLAEQITKAATEFDPGALTGVAALASSVPGESAHLLRSEAYRLLNLPEPDHSAVVIPYEASGLTPTTDRLRACRIALTWDSDTEATAVRWPADVTPAPRRGARSTDTLLAAHADHPRRDIRGNADIVVVECETETAHAELEKLLQDRPACSVAVTTTPDGLTVMRFRDGRTARAETVPAIDMPMGAALVAAIGHDRLVSATRSDTAHIHLTIGSRRIAVRLSHIGGRDR